MSKNSLLSKWFFKSIVDPRVTQVCLFDLLGIPLRIVHSLAAAFMNKFNALSTHFLNLLSSAISRRKASQRSSDSSMISSSSSQSYQLKSCFKRYIYLNLHFNDSIIKYCRIYFKCLPRYFRHFDLPIFFLVHVLALALLLISYKLHIP